MADRRAADVLDVVSNRDDTGRDQALIEFISGRTSPSSSWSTTASSSASRAGSAASRCRRAAVSGSTPMSAAPLAPARGRGAAAAARAGRVRRGRRRGGPSWPSSSRRSSARSIARRSRARKTSSTVGDTVTQGPGALHHRSDEADERDRLRVRRGDRRASTSRTARPCSTASGCSRSQPAQLSSCSRKSWSPIVERSRCA